MEKDISAIELKERVDFFDHECSRLRAELILEHSPTKRFQIEQDLKEAFIQKDIAEKLLEAGSEKLSQDVAQGTSTDDAHNALKGKSNVEYQSHPNMENLDVFISHSSSDESVAEQLVVFIKSALNLQAERIRCTSVNGYRLPAGISTNERLQKEIHESKAFIALITLNSLKSMYVLFELGARWVTKKPLIPLLARGATNNDLREPLSTFNALNCYEAAQLHQFISDLGERLNRSPDSAAAYQKDLNLLMEKAQKNVVLKQTSIKERTSDVESTTFKDSDQAASILLSIWHLDAEKYSENGYNVEEISSKSGINIPICKHYLEVFVGEKKLKRVRVKVIGANAGLHYSLLTAGSNALLKSGLVSN